MRAAVEEIEVSKLESNSLSFSPNELEVTSDVLRINSGICRSHELPVFSQVRVDDVATQSIRHSVTDDVLGAIDEFIRGHEEIGGRVDEIGVETHDNGAVEGDPEPGRDLAAVSPSEGTRQEIEAVRVLDLGVDVKVFMVTLWWCAPEVKPFELDLNSFVKTSHEGESAVAAMSLGINQLRSLNLTFPEAILATHYFAITFWFLSRVGVWISVHA